MKQIQLKGFLLVFSLLYPLAISATSLSPYVTRQVQKAYSLQQQDKSDQAIALLEQIDTEQDYARAYINRMLGQLYWQQELADQAITYLTLAVDSQALLGDERKDSTKMLADLLLQQKSFKLAQVRYKSLLTQYTAPKELASLWFRIAQAQYHQQEWQGVEHSINQHQGHQLRSGQTVAVVALNMKLAAQLGQQHWLDAIDTARTLREREPDNPLWWRQLVTLYIHTEQRDKALAVLQQTERNGIALDDQQLKLLARLYANAQIPEKAAQLYQQIAGIDSSPILLAEQANYWQQAREWPKAINSWQKATKLDSSYYLPLARLYLNVQDYQSALHVLEKLPIRTEDVTLLKVQALSALKRKEEALTLIKAQHEKAPSAVTLQWIKYLTN